jgi:glycolate oxidase FAD binding subunit
MLGCEPPEFRGLGTVGGALAAGLSGPGKPWRGSLRDAVLGIRMVNGLGEVLRFGGEVMKNVAGYDVSRLQAGAFGTLGLLLEVSLRVAPLPHAEQTLALELEAGEALDLMRSLCRQPLPITGLAHHDGRLRVRLSGAEPAVQAAAQRVGGEREDSDFWRRLSDQQLGFFREAGTALRLERCAPAAPLPRSWRGLMDWGGARRWTADEATHGVAFASSYARSACLEPGGNAVIGAYQARLRAAFDPESILNRELTRADVAA